MDKMARAFVKCPTKDIASADPQIQCHNHPANSGPLDLSILLLGFLAWNNAILSMSAAPRLDSQYFPRHEDGVHSTNAHENFRIQD